MGLFSSKSVTTVGTQVQRVIEDTSLPNSIATGVMKNLYGNDDQMIEYVLEELSQSVAVRAERMFAYGRDTYTFGLPKSSLKTSAAGRDATLAAIRASAGTGVSLQYYHFGPYNHLHFGWKALVEQYGYDSSTNQIATLGAAKGTAVYLVDMQVVVTQTTLESLANGSMDQWGTAANAGYVPNGLISGLLSAVKAPTPFAVDATASEDYILITYCWTDTSTAITKYPNETLRIPVTGLDAHADYHQAKYTVNGRDHYWTYQHGAGSQPAIDAVFDTVYAEGGSFFPITYFRYNRTVGNANKSDAWYIQSKKLLDSIGMDFDSIATTINSNPDIADVEQAMMMFAVPASTNNPMEQRYLFDFFSGIYDEMAPVQGATSRSVAFMNLDLRLGNTVQDTSIIIQDARFKMALAYKTIVRRLVPGKIGKINSYASGDNSSSNNLSVPMVGGSTIEWSTPQEMHWYRHQITETMYEEIQVHGLKMTYWIFENYTTTGDGTSNLLLIPIDNAITKHYSLPDRELLYSRSMQYIFNSRTITKLKWYQTGIFKALTVIIAIVITVLSDGTTWESIMAALATVTVEQVLVYLLTKVITYLVMQYAFKLFVKVVGVKFAFIAAVIAALAGAYQIYTSNSLTTLPTGSQLLTAASGLSKSVQIGLQDNFTQLQQQANDFKSEVDSKEKLLKDAESLLDTGLNLSPLVIFGESPNDFYQRTVHSGNIGTVGIDVVSNYVDLALQLPKISNTLGDLYG